MRKITEFIKKYWILILVVLALILFVVNSLIKKPTLTPTATPLPKQATFKSILPGVSTESDLNKILGSPLRTTVSNNQKTDEYKSTSELRHHSAVIEGGKVLFIDEIVSAQDTAKASSITDVYGQSPDILYSKFPNATFNLYVYPSNGIAYLGADDGTLLEVWYFEPTTIESFQSTWGKDYSITPPAEQIQ